MRPDSLHPECARRHWLSPILRQLIAATLSVVPLIIYTENQFPTSARIKFPFFMMGVALAALVWSVGLLGNRGWHRWDGFAFAAALLLTYLAVRCQFLDSARQYGWFETAPMMAGVLWALILAGFLRTRWHIQWLLRATLAAVIPVTLYGILQICHYDPFYEFVYGLPGQTWSHEWLEGWQTYSSFGNPNYLAGYLGPWLLLTPALYAGCRTPWGKVLTAVVVVGVFLVLVRTYARGIWLSLLAGGVTYVLCWWYGKGSLVVVRLRARYLAAASLLALGMVVLVPLVADVGQLLEDFHSGFLLRDSSVRARLLLGVLASNLWQRAPWIGVGTDRFASNMNEELYQLTAGPLGDSLRDFTSNLITVRYDEAHNDYLQVLAEWGIIGLGLLLLVFAMAATGGWSALRREQRLDRRDLLTPSLLGAFVVGLAHLAYDFPLRLAGASLVLWTVIGCLAALGREDMKQAGRRAGATARYAAAVLGLGFATAFAAIAPAAIASEYLLYHGVNNREAGELMLTRGDTNQASVYFGVADSMLQRAIRLEPENGEIRFEWGVTYLHSAGLLGDDYFSKARDRMSQAASTHLPPQHFYYMAVAQMNLEQYDRAQESLQRLLIINPVYPGANYSLGWMYYRMGRFPDAVAHFQRELALEPEHIDALKYLGETQYLHMEDYSSAVKTYLALLEIDNGFGIAHQLLGDIYASPGRFYDPGAASEHYFFARNIYEAQGRSQDAKRMETQMRALPVPAAERKRGRN